MSQQRPRIVVVVPNRITGDSRVIKTAMAAARAGWDVTLLGLGRGRRQETRLGPVTVVRVPIRRPNHEAYERGLRTVTARRSPVAYRDETSAKAAGAALGRYVARRRDAATGWRRPVAEAELLARRVLHRARGWGRGHETVRTPAVPAEHVQWRRDWPILLDWQETFGPAIEELEPDLVHANDAIMIGVVAEAVRRMRAAGRTVAWVYDAHEHVSAVDWGGPVTTAAYCAYEKEYIDQPDAVVTVSGEIARMLQDEYGLAQLPAVVRNVPIHDVELADPPSVRAAAGVPDDAPLLVYSGYLARERGIDTVIAALTRLPDVWLAIVAMPSALLDEFLRLAEELGVRDRVGVAPYVPPHAVPAYLSAADFGVIASLHSPNYEASTPTKLSEYLHARLPLLVSDLRANSEFVRGHGVGEVFVAGDPDSLAATYRAAALRREELRANIAGPLLAELSWEAQTEVLFDVYAKVAGRVPEPPAEPVGWDVVETTVTGEPVTGL
jgi:glycosyltransferase involved in cell wall biosynthesis